MDADEALTLAAIGYRGCEYNLSNPHSRKIVFDEIGKCLNIFSAVKGKWDLVWGPAGYCTGAVGLDDSAMFVVRNTHEPASLAIVIRGTNFFSLRDWETNFLIDPKPWPYGNAGDDVRISHSTSLGLGILQTLRSENPLPAPAPENESDHVKAAAAAYEAHLGYSFLTSMLGGPTPFNIGDIAARVSSKIKDSFGANDDAGILDDAKAAQPQSDSAKTLLQFLTGFVATSKGPADISVIGHSKGGALTPALALWLADTQGLAVAASDQWDPQQVAVLHSYSFAGPTPGNGGFAKRFKRRFPAAYRLFNPHDIVTHVWDPAELRQIPNLYGDQLEVLEVPVQALALLVGRLGYQHEIDAQPWPDAPLEPGSLPAHLAFNHLDAYLTKLGILDDAQGLSFLKLFAPIAS